MEPVPVAALTLNFSPMSWIAPPPFGTEIDGIALVGGDFSSVDVVGNEVCGIVSWTPSLDFFLVLAFPLENVLEASLLENILKQSLDVSLVVVCMHTKMLSSANQLATGWFYSVMRNQCKCNSVNSGDKRTKPTPAGDQRVTPQLKQRFDN